MLGHQSSAVLRPDGHHAAACVPSGGSQHSGRCSMVYRETLVMEWAIDRQLLDPVLSRWRTPVIDLFATFANKKLPVYASPFPDSRAKYVDAMSVPWSGMGTVYAFPPFRMLPVVISKIQRAHSLRVILITPQTVSVVDARLGNVCRLPFHWCKTDFLSYHRRWCCPTGAQKPDITSLETLKALFRSLGHSQRVAELMTQTLWHSSLEVYEGHWKYFVAYCRAKRLNVYNVQSRHFSKYLLHRQQSSIIGCPSLLYCDIGNMIWPRIRTLPCCSEASIW